GRRARGRRGAAHLRHLRQRDSLPAAAEYPGPPPHRGAGRRRGGGGQRMRAVDTPTTEFTTTEFTAAEADLLSRVPDGLFIGGAWEAGTREQIQVQDPATGRVIKRIANATPEDGIRALDAAVAA